MSLDKTVLIEDAIFGLENYKGDILTHSVRVASMFERGSIEYFVALLHDTVEDGILSLEQVEKMDSTFQFEGCLFKAVKAISRKEGTTYNNYLEFVKDNSVAIKVKLSDLIDNLRIPPVYSIDVEINYQKMRMRNIRYREALQRLLF